MRRPSTAVVLVGHLLCAAGCGGNAAVTGAAAAGDRVPCAMTVSSTVSSAIPTVGVVAWSTTLAGAKSARIDFGPTTSYGMTAPVAAVETNNRTLLLGMKTSRTYHYRVTATSDAGSCDSQDYTIATGALANGLMKPTLSPATAAGLYGGFLVTGQHAHGAGAGATAHIFDADGDYVWWFSIAGPVSSARMDYAGTHMWINAVNVPSGTARVHRVSMDGLVDEDLSAQFAGLNHQLTILPDETVAFYAYGANGCDDIKERAPSGEVRTIVNAQTALAAQGDCHVNNIQYSQPDDTLLFSDLDHNQVAKVRRSDGSTVWILNGMTRTFTSGDTWSGGEHGLHPIAPSRLLIFNNNITGRSSIAIELALDTATNTATRVWSYTASPGIVTLIMGDLQRLPNGNTIVGYSTSGTLHEVSAAGTRLQSWTWPAGSQFGYIEKRATLYGPPPR